MGILTRLADNTKRGSITHGFRIKRFKLFKELIKDLPRPVKILDLGGTETFWEMMDFLSDDIELLILNTEPQRTHRSNVKIMTGDARNLSRFTDGQFDVVFSNSVIEHVGSFSDQKIMAGEVMRAGKIFFVQTPNYYFPFEPHFLFPFFQFLPLSLKVFLIRNFSLGWFQKSSSKEEAEKLARSVSLLTPKKMNELFPGATLHREKFLLLTKSLIVYKSRG